MENSGRKGIKDIVAALRRLRVQTGSLACLGCGYRKAADKWEKRHPVTDTFDLRVQDALREAATALSTLQAENEKLRAELEQVKAERDVAVKAIERVRSCKDCGYYTGEWTPPCKECQDSEEHHPYFKWRGQKED